MAFEANLSSQGARYRVRTQEERQRAFRSAKRHTRFVYLLRGLLPVVAVLVLGAYFISTRMNVTVGDFTASIDGMEVAEGSLRMLNPTLEGADKKNGKYIVKAEYADQDIANPDVVKLHAIKADIEDPSGGWSKMQAVRGVFNSKSERLIMKDRITVATSSGLTGELKYATMDMETQTLRSHNPVFFELNSGNATVRANAMTLRSKERILHFRGKVAVHLQPDKLRAAREAQPGQPATPAPAATAPSGAAPVGGALGAAQVPPQ